MRQISMLESTKVYKMRTTHLLRTIAISILFATLVGCGDYTHTTQKAREEYYAGQYLAAAESLKAGANEEGPDQLLYILDRATALYNGGMFDEAIKEFSRADKMAEIKDYTSLSKEAASLVVNDRLLPYKGEDFEKVLINQYLALCYLMKSDTEAALVENRRVNRKLYLMISEGKRKYRLNPMARLLSALIYESQGQFNDAYIDYKAVQKLLPSMVSLGPHLYATAWASGISEDLEKWQKQYGLSAEQLSAAKAELKQAEIIFILEVGKAPIKQPHPQWHALPKFYPRPNPVASVRLSISSQGGSEQVGYQVAGDSWPLFDIEATAIKDLDEKWAGLLAKRIGGVVIKETAATIVDEKVSPILGMAMRIGGFVADQADLRSWLTLPQNFQIIRYRVPIPGKYEVRLQPLDASGNPAVGYAPIEKSIEVPEWAHKGRPKAPAPKVFVPVRVL